MAGRLLLKLLLRVEHASSAASRMHAQISAVLTGGGGWNARPSPYLLCRHPNFNGYMDTQAPLFASPYLLVRYFYYDNSTVEYVSKRLLMTEARADVRLLSNGCVKRQIMQYRSRYESETASDTTL